MMSTIDIELIDVRSLSRHSGMIYCGFAWPRLLERIWAASLFCEHPQSLGFVTLLPLVWQHVHAVKMTRDPQHWQEIEFLICNMLYSEFWYQICTQGITRILWKGGCLQTNIYTDKCNGCRFAKFRFVSTGRYWVRTSQQFEWFLHLKSTYAIWIWCPISQSCNTTLVMSKKSKQVSLI